MHHIGMSTAPTLYPNLEFDPLEDFRTIGQVTEVPMTIVGRADLEPNTLEELVDYVEANADTITYANAGIGAASHLCGRLFEDATGLDVTEVSYEGTEPALTDLLGGHVDFMCDQTTNTTEYIQSGQVKAYAVTTAERVASLPEIPTATEAGLEGIAFGVWHGLYVPAGASDEVVQRLTEALQTALQDQTVKDRLAELGAAPSTEDQATPEALTQTLEEQIDLWAPLLEPAPTAAPASPAGS
jgi:tripartite-type tricarboxylate transporter receptor subunit TctC